ncbi:MAG: ATP-binding protein [Verrucomicrobia bacterium]|nr:ATP-binding protein [Verrucomicrobiota bacterium]
MPDKPRDPTEVGKKGAGFGLVLSQMLAKRMGGQLSVETSNSQGTTFRLNIPLQWLPEGHLEGEPKNQIYETPSNASPI